MTWQAFLGLFARHALGAAGAALVTMGLLTEGQVEPFVGAAMLLLTLGWSGWQKYGQTWVVARLAKMRAVAPKNATIAEAARLGTEAVKQEAAKQEK